MSSSSYLAATQRRLWRLIAHPEGVRSALDTERDEPPLAALVRSDEQLCAEDRLDVYANAYFYRILEVLLDDYPVLSAALGDDPFHDLATSYLAVHPSEHPSLRFIGSKLAPFLRESEAAEGVRARAPWSADLAAFEWAKGEVFDAVDAATAARAELEGTPPEQFETLALRLIPAVRLLSLDWPVDALRADADDLVDAVAALEPSRAEVCVWRRNERTLARRLDEIEAAALARARSGLHFGALCALAAERASEEEAPAMAASWLARWLDEALLLPFSA